MQSSEISHLGELGTLEQLAIGSPKISPVGLGRLGSIPKLRVLDLRRAPSRDLRPLKALPLGARLSAHRARVSSKHAIVPLLL
jgi:hypothetical protein